jgi:hypothetical protein
MSEGGGETRIEPREETLEEILDREFASGEIDNFRVRGRRRTRLETTPTIRCLRTGFGERGRALRLWAPACRCTQRHARLRGGV